VKILVIQESDWVERGPHNSHHLFEGLSEKGHEIRVIDYEISWKENNHAGVVSRRTVISNFHKVRSNARITIIRPTIIRVTPINYLSLLYTHTREIKRQINEFQPDVIIGLGLLNAYIALSESKKYGIPFVYFILDTLHTLVHEKYFQPVARLVERRNYRQASLVVSVNKLLREYTKSMGADDKKAVLLPHGIEYSKFFSSSKGRDAARHTYGFGTGDIVLFYMGYLYEFSGLVELASHLKDNVEKYNRIKLFILGKGPAFNPLIELSKSIPENLIVLGWQPYSEIPSIISAADLCILPARDNATMRNIVPIKIYEYMAAAKPVLTTDLPGIKSEFGGLQGIFYVKRPEEILDRSTELYRRGTFEEDGKAVREFVKQHDWDILIARFETMLNEVVSK